MKSKQDKQIDRVFREHFAKAGLSYQQIQALRSWAEGIDLSKMSAQDAARSLTSFAEQRGIPAGAVADAIALHGEMHAAVQRDGIGAVARFEQVPAAAEDQRLIDQDRQMLRTDPEGRFRDKLHMERVTEARERQQQAADKAERDQAAPAADEPAGKVDGARQKLADVLRDPVKAAEYWRSPELQAKYRADIGKAINADAAAEKAASAIGPTRSPEFHMQQVEEIREMLRTPEGEREYRSKPAMQEEFRQALERSGMAEAGPAPGPRATGVQQGAGVTHHEGG